MFSSTWFPAAFVVATAVIAVFLRVVGAVADLLTVFGRLGIRRFRRTRVHVDAHHPVLASHLLRRQDQLDAAAQWDDKHYTELESEISRRHRPRRWRRRRSAESTRIHRSLSRALRAAREPFLLLEGEPGSGKSVALRHVARSILVEPTWSAAIRGEARLLPLYVDLRGFRSAHPRPTAEEICSYVCRTVAGPDNEQIRRYLHRGLIARDGPYDWLILFDSFDEIPAVLSARDRSDSVVNDFADAVFEFLLQTDNCRAVVASRQFRGPQGRLAWPTMQVLPLSLRRINRFVTKRVSLPVALEDQLYASIRSATTSIGRFARNPQFLGLLADHVRETERVPPDWHIVFKSFIDRRLHRDAERVKERFGVDAKELHGAACVIAAAMTEQSVGLSPPRRSLLVHPLVSGPGVSNIHLDALLYIDLLRPEVDGDKIDASTVRFVHRRMQEFFATEAVLGQYVSIDPALLVDDGAWRETAVVLLQRSAQPESSSPIQIEALLSAYLVDPVVTEENSVHWSPRGVELSSFAGVLPVTADADVEHVMKILGEAAVAGSSVISRDCREKAGRLLEQYALRSARSDQLWIVPSALGADQVCRQNICEAALVSRSRAVQLAGLQLLAEIRLVSTRTVVPLTRALASAMATRAGFRTVRELGVHIRRFDREGRFSRLLLFFWALPWLDAIVQTSVAALLLALASGDPWRACAATGAVIGLGGAGANWVARRVQWGVVPKSYWEKRLVQLIAIVARLFAIIAAAGIAVYGFGGHIPWWIADDLWSGDTATMVLVFVGAVLGMRWLSWTEGSIIEGVPLGTAWFGPASFFARPNWRGRAKLFGGVVVAYVAGSVGLAAGLNAVVGWLELDRESWGVQYGPIVPLAVVCLGALVFLASDMRRGVLAARRMRRISSSGTELTSTELVAATVAMSGTGIEGRLVEHLHSTASLTDDCYLALWDVLRYADARSLVRDGSELSYLAMSEAVVHYQQNGGSIEWFANLSAEVLDSIAALLDGRDEAKRAIRRAVREGRRGSLVVPEQVGDGGRR
jgi:hypothetical protein